MYVSKLYAFENRQSPAGIWPARDLWSKTCVYADNDHYDSHDVTAHQRKCDEGFAIC